jgi:DNA invertase Pin-like site-specific DNA recombinase
MNPLLDSKVTADHLRRDAYLYVRQSTVRQVLENTESTQRQYALRQRAVALGWPADRVVVIDEDLGRSGAAGTERRGFQHLVAQVGLGRVGIVLGLEVSRLARSSSDWHRLLEICALTDTLILDEDGLYDPAHFNDRLLLGLKGTMSEAELHVLRARLRGGLLNKARRGELRCPLPVGLLYDAAARVVLDPDQQVQQSLRLLFDTFARTGSVSATVKHFRQQQLLFPSRLAPGSAQGQLSWAPLALSRCARVLHNPWYAGAYVYGRGRFRQLPDGRVRHLPLPASQWQVLIPQAHPGYLSWEEYQRNQQRLQERGKSVPWGHQATPPREGPALLQGRAVCGLCGSRMQVRYNHRRGDQNVPVYVCYGHGRELGAPACQSLVGTALDAAIGQLLVEAVTPMAVELALAVQQELEQRRTEADHLRHRQVERAQWEADQARQRYMQVDPTHRLVADTLEADWNAKLRALEAAQQAYEQQRTADALTLDPQQRQRLLALATDFPRIWADPRTPARERKRMLALLIEDVTLIKQQQITAAVRFRGGATTTLTLPRPLSAAQLRLTTEEVRQQLDALLDKYTDAQVAHRLNQQGLRTGAGAPFTAESVSWARRAHQLPSLKQRLLKQGWVTGRQARVQLGIGRPMLRHWRLTGRIKAHACSDLAEWLYWLPPTTPDSPSGATPVAEDGSPARGAV